MEEFGPFHDTDLLSTLRERAHRVAALVPECVGISVTSLAEGVTFTLAAPSSAVAAVETAPRPWTGPGERGAPGAVAVDPGPSPLDETAWQALGQATAAAGVMSTLTLPILDEDEAVGSVHLYASTPTAFEGRHEEAAAIFAGWAPGAVSNADLSFSTRETAEMAPQIKQREYRISVAVGHLARRDGITLGEAHRLLAESSRRSGISEAAFAEYVLEGLEPTDE